MFSWLTRILSYFVVFVQTVLSTAFIQPTPTPIYTPPIEVETTVAPTATVAPTPSDEEVALSLAQGTAGVLYIPGYTTVKLYSVNVFHTQGTIDANDSAAIFDYKGLEDIPVFDGDTTIIADHSNQAFYCLNALQVGSTMYIVKGKEVQKYILEQKIYGHNATATSDWYKAAYIADENGNSLYKNWSEGVTLQTCDGPYYRWMLRYRRV